MQPHTFQLLSALCPTMFEEAETLAREHGPRGAFRGGWSNRTNQWFLASTIRLAERRGFIADDHLTECGQTAFQEALITKAHRVLAEEMA